MRPEPVISSLFLDFDGVICDSLEECFRSSWLAGSEVNISAAFPPEPPVDQAYRSRFDACRPFVRSGEDYLVVHEWAGRGRVPGSQDEFDASLREKGPAVMAKLKTRLYEVRDRLLDLHLDLWLSWNPLYPGMAKALAAQNSNSDVWILSTKKAEFIVKILAYHGVSWPLARTLYTGTKRKLDIIGDLVQDRTSCLIDDQIDHLDFGHLTCRCILASWGYVTPGATTRASRSWDLDTAVRFVSSFPLARHLPG